MGFPTSAEKMLDWKPIGHGLEGAVRYDVIWLRGPCGAVHPLSHEAARELAGWLADQAAPTIDGKAEEAARAAPFDAQLGGPGAPVGFR